MASKKKPHIDDTALIEELLIILRHHFRTTYTGYDTWIERKNLIEHIYELCFEDTKSKERYNCIQRILTE